MLVGICRFDKESKSDFVQRAMMGLSVSHELHWIVYNKVRNLG